MRRAQRRRDAIVRSLLPASSPTRLCRTGMRRLGGFTLNVRSFVVLTVLVLTQGLAPAHPAWAQNQPVVRVTAGDHPYFGRVVMNAPGLSYAVNRDGAHVAILFSNDPVLGDLPPTPRNVLAIRAVPGGIELTVPLGANVRTTRYGDKVVVDIDDTVANRPPLAPLTDLQPRPQRDPGTPSSRAGEPGASAASAAPAGQQTVPLPAAAGGGPKENAPQPGEPSGNAASVNAPPERTSTAPSRNEILGQAAQDHSRAAGLPEVVSPARLHGSLTQLPLPTAPETGELKSGPALQALPGHPAENASEPVAASAIPGRTGAENVSSVTFAPIAQDATALTQAAAPLTLPPAIAQTPAVAPQATPQSPGMSNATPVTRSDSAPAVPPDATALPQADNAAVSQGPVQVWPVTQNTLPLGPAALRAIRSRPPNGLAGVAIGLPFRGAVGAALLSRGSDIFVVFDERRPIDLSALQDDPVFGPAVVTLYPTATVIRLAARPGQSAMLFPDPLGWRLSMVPDTPKPAAFAETVTEGGITFAAGAPGQVVAITDPRTGGTLLFGTQRISGEGVLIERRTPEFDLPATGQGIVVDPLSDAISLRITQAGFVLSGGPSALALSPPQPMPEATIAAARLTRQFEFPRQTTETLLQRAKKQRVAVARTPLLKRGPLRHALAESMLGLGRGAEAQTLLQVTMKDDPREADSPTTIGLAAIAALLANRPGEAGGLADPRLTGTDEIALWRAIQMAMQDDASAAAAAVLASTAPLLFTYPPELRHRVLPLAMETMIRGGQAAAAAPLLGERPSDPRLAYARAMLKQAQGDNAGALAMFDALANSRSDLDHARAEARATELRLAMGKLDNKAAADALEAQLDAWRGGARDFALRLRIAELRQKDGGWRAVFAQLRSAKADFPDRAEEVDRRLKDAFAAVAHDPLLAKMEPTELIAMLDENAELMPDGPDGEPMRLLLAEKLMALDLPKQADPLLVKLLRAAPFGPARAGFGATLATLRLREGDADGALLALSESNSADMDDAVRQRRALITAHVEAKRGNPGEAVATLSGDQTQDADEARAAILEQAQQWPAARDALVRLAARVIPDSGLLNDAQLRVVLRLATAAARADDDATLASLRDKLGTRIGSGAQADMFRLLTAPPVRGTSDLPQARADMTAIRAVADDMRPKKTAATSP